METIDAIDSSVTTDGVPNSRKLIELETYKLTQNHDNQTVIHEKPENAHGNKEFQKSVEELYAKVDKSAKTKAKRLGGKTMEDETVMYDNNGLYLNKTETNLSAPYETVMQENDLYVCWWQKRNFLPCSVRMDHPRDNWSMAVSEFT